MNKYIDLTDGQVYESVATALIEYGYQQQTIDFAFDIYWLNEQTLENLLYWQGIDEDEFLKSAGLTDY